MHQVTRVIKLGHSLAVVIPSSAVRVFSILPGDVLVVSYTDRNLDIRKLKDIINGKGKKY